MCVCVCVCVYLCVRLCVCVHVYQFHSLFKNNCKHSNLHFLDLYIHCLI